MNDKVIQKLKDLAKKAAWFDNKDFNAFDWSGGNYDDAYQGGFEDGQIGLARDILEILKEN